MKNDKPFTLPVPAYDLPDSYFLSAESRQALAFWRSAMTAMQEQAKVCRPKINDLSPAALRQRQAQDFYKSEPYQILTQRYQTHRQEETLGGVDCEVFTPLQGISEKNQQRVLINLHGGGFESGALTLSHLESIPVATLGQIKVVSVDYRLTPEYRFPAPVEDVVAVYQALLDDYPASNIGIFGSSAGAVLTAQTLARISQEGLPVPAAVSMISGAASKRAGDSMAMVAPMLLSAHGLDLHAENRRLPYFQDVDLSDPLFLPAVSDRVMAGFPPTLLMTSTRDYLMSAVLATHRQLTRLGVEAELQVWDGLEHVFHYNAALPESQELHRHMLQFFNQHLS